MKLMTAIVCGGLGMACILNAFFPNSKIIYLGMIIGPIIYWFSMKDNKKPSPIVSYVERQLIYKFEIYINENHENGIFKDFLEIQEITGTELRDIILIIKNSDYFLKNSKGNYTTRTMYLKHMKFWPKVWDMFDGKIR